MTDEEAVPIAFVIVNELLDDEGREEVTRRVLDHLPDAADDLQRDLRRGIRRCIQVDGFRNSDRAPKGRQLPEIVRSGFRDARVLPPLLRVWVDSHADLRAEVEAFLTARGDTVCEPDSSATDFPDVWSLAALNEVAGEFRETSPDHHPRDVRLMLCWVSGKGAIPIDPEPMNYDDADDADPEGTDMPQDETWQQILATLDDVPPESEAWDEFDAFVDAAAELALMKITERESGRETLREALASLAAKCEEALTYHGKDDALTWTAEVCEAGAAEALAERVTAFAQSLSAEQELRSKIPTSVAEEDELAEQRRGLRAQINALYEQLRPELVDDTPDDEAPDDADEDNEPDPLEPETEHSKAEADDTVEDSFPPETPAKAESADKPEPGPEDTPPAEAEPETGTDAPVEPPAEGETAEIQTSTDVARDASEPEAPTEEEDTSCFEPDPDRKAPSEKPSAFCGLRTSQIVATNLMDSDDPELWNEFMWTLAAEGDLAGAYWVARSTAASQSQAHLPEWLMEATAGGLWIGSDADPLSLDLMEIVASEQQPVPNTPEATLGVAAALRPTLVAPSSGMLSWLSIACRCPELRTIAERVREFAARAQGHPLTAARFDAAVDADAMEQTIQDAANAARALMEERPARKTKHKRTRDVWQRLVHPDGDVHRLLRLAAEDKRAQVVEVRKACKQMTADPMRRVHAIDRELHGAKPRPIDGRARDWILRQIEDAVSAAARWCEAVECQSAVGQGIDWLQDQVTQLRDHVRGRLTDALRELQSAGEGADTVQEAAAASVAGRMVHSLASLLEIDSGEIDSAWQHTWLATGVADLPLASALGRRLLLVPQISLDSNGLPFETDLFRIRELLRDELLQPRSLVDIVRQHMEKENFAAARMLLELALPESAAERAELETEFVHCMADARAKLAHAVDETDSRIDWAVVEGFAINEGAELKAELLNVSQAQDGDDDVLDFRPLFARLNRIDERLGAARDRRLEELAREWREIRQTVFNSPLSERKRGSVISKVDRALEQGDIRFVDEAMADLQRVTAGDRALEDTVFSTAPAEAAASWDRLRAVEQWVRSANSLTPLIRQISEGEERAGIQYDSLPRRRLRESVAALESWLQLKRGRPHHRDNGGRIVTVLRFLGFQYERSLGSSIAIEETGGEWAHARVQMSAGDDCPVPQFGSETNGEYDVLCLWERPGADAIGACLQELRLDRRNVITFYLGRLTRRQRLDMASQARDRELSLVMLDEVVLFYLTGERDRRLRPFFWIALPFSSLNPYMPYRAGNVPREMFYGRRQMAEQLYRGESCIVYGGRQLGKSALLQHVQRRAHNPDRDDYAWVEDIKLIGPPDQGHGPEVLWRRIRQRFQEWGLMPKQARATDPERLRDLILDAMSAHPQARVWLFLDEADRFLDHDADVGFPSVDVFRQLMLATERRFKVTFAGLHNVQRFQAMPNQPLAHFGKPICIGPLEPPSAMDLVREPFQALGYRFDDDTTVLRVLSYTNYHAGLIQLFCDELLKRLRRQPTPEKLPVVIARDDVDAVYRDRDVRDRIRERFDWTLALDPRYQAIAWTMVFEQMYDADGYAMDFSTDEVLEHCRGSWPKGFSAVSRDEMAGLIDEMCGLGVLSAHENRYRLRSPNLVRLMGTPSEVVASLDALADKSPDDQVLQAHAQHAPLDEEALEYSPYTNEQASLIAAPRTGVRLVSGSKALNVSLAERAWRSFMPQDLERDRWSVACIPQDVCQSGESMDDWLRQHIDEHSRCEQVWLFAELPSGADPVSVTAAAIETCRKRDSGNRLLSITLLLSPEVLWRWLGAPPATRTDLEERTHSRALVPLRRWDHSSLRVRLEHHEIMFSDEILQILLQATSGWPLLVDELLRRCADTRDPKPSASAIETELATAGSPLRAQFIAATGVDVDPNLIPMLRALTRLGGGEPIPESMVRELVDEEQGMDAEECSRALEYLSMMSLVGRSATEGDTADLTFRVDPVLATALGE